MLGRTGLAAWLAGGCAAAALAQAPAANELPKQVDAHWAALRRTAGPGEDPAVREQAADALAALAARNDLDAESKKRLLAGAREFLTGADDTARGLLLTALGAKDRQAAAEAWRDPLLALVFDPALPIAAMPIAVRRLCDADVRGVADAIATRVGVGKGTMDDRRRAIEAAGAFLEQDFRAWGPVEACVRALDEEALTADALRVLRRALVLPDTTTKDDVRKWWSQHRTRPPGNVMTERLRREIALRADEAARTELLHLRLIESGDVTLAVKLLEATASRVRAAAAQRLRALDVDKARAALEPLARRLESESVPEVQLACAEALGRLVGPGDTLAIEALAGRARAPTDAPVRAAAIAALGESRAAAARFVLLEALRVDKDAAVRRAAAQALPRFRGQVDVAAIAPALLVANEPSPDVRADVAKTLGELGKDEGDPAACALLAAALRDDPDREVRWHAASQLDRVKSGGTEVVDALALAVAQDSTWKVRGRAAELLGRRRRPEEREPALAALLGALADAEGAVRAAARAGLVDLAAKDAPTLLVFAGRAEDRSRHAACELLEAALAAPPGNGGTTLDEARRGEVRRRLVDLWQRAVKDGVEPKDAADRAVTHARALYGSVQTLEAARTIGTLLDTAERHGDAMEHWRGAAARFTDVSEELLARGLDALDRLAERTLEVRAADALTQLGELPSALHGRRDRLRAAAVAARKLEEAGNGPGPRAEWHQLVTAASGPTLAGYVEASLRRLEHRAAMAREADAALELVLGPRPDNARLGETSTPEERAAARTAWQRAWEASDKRPR